MTGKIEGTFFTETPNQLAQPWYLLPVELHEKILAYSGNPHVKLVSRYSYDIFQNVMRIDHLRKIFAINHLNHEYPWLSIKKLEGILETGVNAKTIRIIAKLSMELNNQNIWPCHIENFNWRIKEIQYFSIHQKIPENFTDGYVRSIISTMRSIVNLKGSERRYLIEQMGFPNEDSFDFQDTLAYGIAHNCLINPGQA